MIVVKSLGKWLLVNVINFAIPFILTEYSGLDESLFFPYRQCLFEFVTHQGRVDYFADENDYVINLSNFQPRPIGAVTQTTAQHVRPWLGMDHVNKAPKRSR